MISFFEEYPTKENLSRLKYVKWPTKLYVAASSLDEFLKLRKDIKNKYIREVVYWPILEKKEGYWISPFSKRKALIRIFSELEGKNLPVMLDLELPTSRNPWLYLTQLLNFFRNKKLIRNCIQKNKEVYLCEYFPEGKWKERMLELLGVHYSNHNAKVIKMVYQSMHKFDKDFIRDEIRNGKKEHGKKFIIALGTIAKGVLGNESLLSVKQLREDLSLVKELNVREIVLFRLGGLNKKYSQVLKEHSTHTT